jgi:bacteriocin biosynthesis cyclodehydratase domain-containing protein
MLLPGLAVLWRGPRTLQVGLDHRRAIALDLPNPTAAGLLPLLDGGRTETGLIAAAARRGIGEGDARSLLDALSRHGLVVGVHTVLPRGLSAPVRARIAAEAASLALRRGDGLGPAEVLRRRGAARVRVTGRSRLGVPIAVSLALAGVGHVDAALLLGSVEPGELMAGGPTGPRAEAAARVIAEVAPGTRSNPLPRREDATFVVQVGIPPGPASLHALAHRRIAHLAVAVRDGAAIVGPLVPPGGRPCLNCLDLHRADRDPAWPALAAQLATPDAPPLRDVVEACATATALATTGYVTAEVLRYLDGDPAHTTGATVELSGAGETRRRTWNPHPDCHCSRQRRPRRIPVPAGGLGE